MKNFFKKLAKTLIIALIGSILGSFMYVVIIFCDPSKDIIIGWFIFIGGLAAVGIDLCGLLGISWILDQKDDLPPDY